MLHSLQRLTWFNDGAATGKAAVPRLSPLIGLGPRGQYQDGTGLPFGTPNQLTRVVILVFAA